MYLLPKKNEQLCGNVLACTLLALVATNCGNDMRSAASDDAPNRGSGGSTAVIGNSSFLPAVGETTIGGATVANAGGTSSGVVSATQAAGAQSASIEQPASGNASVQAGGAQSTSDIQTTAVAGAPSFGPNQCAPNGVVSWDDLTEVLFRDVPTVVSDFLTAFLSSKYIETYFRFYQPPYVPAPGKEMLVIRMTYGSLTIDGSIEWGTKFGDKLAYLGPSSDTVPRIDRENAVKQVEAAGCKLVNVCTSLKLTLERAPGPIPEVTNEYYQTSYYFGWVTGGESNLCSTDARVAHCDCVSNRCALNADTGVMDFRSGTMACTCPLNPSTGQCK